MSIARALSEIERLLVGTARTGAALATAAVLHGGAAQAQTVFHVDDDAAAGGDGLSWGTAFRDLNDGLLAAKLQGGWQAVVKIAGGVYRPDRGSGNRNVSFVVAGSAVTLMGGFAGVGAANPDEHDPSRFASILSGDLAGNDGPGFTNRADNSLGVLRFEGAISASAWDLVIRGGSGATEGGGVRVGAPERPASAILWRCRITENEALQGGGLATAPGSYVFLLGCDVDGNRAWSNAGGLWIGRSDLWSTRIRGNTGLHSGMHGAQIWVHERAASFEQCLIDGHGSTGIGATLVSFDAPVTLRGCTLITGGAGRIALDGPQFTIAGSVIASGDGTGCRLVEFPNTTLAVARSCLHVLDRDLNHSSGTAIVGPGVVFGEPKFVRPRGLDGMGETWQDNDYRLASGSPAIDLSDPAWRSRDALDADGDGDVGEAMPRDLGGAFRLVDDAGMSDAGSAGMVLDAGAFEFQGTSCRADFDASGAIGVNDVLVFLIDWLGDSADADFDRSGTLNTQDIFDYLAAYFAGCV